MEQKRQRLRGRKRRGNGRWSERDKELRKNKNGKKIEERGQLERKRMKG